MTKTCKHGHEMTEANTIRMKAGGEWNGKTQCRACKKVQSTASRIKCAGTRSERLKARRAAAHQQQAAE